MKYSEWMRAHGEKHDEIVSLLSGKSVDEIIDYFDYDNMRSRHPDFCPLYKKNQKCHEIERLNCFLCGCVYFRYNDDGIDESEGRIRYSKCSISARKSREFIACDAIHLDCSECDIPHRASVAKKHFDKKWSAMMSGCDLKD